MKIGIVLVAQKWSQVGIISHAMHGVWKLKKVSFKIASEAS